MESIIKLGEWNERMSSDVMYGEPRPDCSAPVPHIQKFRPRLPFCLQLQPSLSAPLFGPLLWWSQLSQPSPGHYRPHLQLLVRSVGSHSLCKHQDNLVELIQVYQQVIQSKNLNGDTKSDCSTMIQLRLRLRGSII